VHLRQRHA